MKPLLLDLITNLESTNENLEEMLTTPPVREVVVEAPPVKVAKKKTVKTVVKEETPVEASPTLQPAVKEATPPAEQDSGYMSGDQ